MNSSKNCIFTVIFIAIIWWGLSKLNWPVIPAPCTAVKTFVSLLRSAMLIHMATSLYRILTAIFFAFCIGVPFGLLLGMEQKVDDYFSFIILLLYPIPKIVFLPVLLMLLGLGELPRIMLISTIIFFHMVITSRDAAKNLPPGSVDSIKSLGGKKCDIYIHVVIPACMPQIFTSLRISLGTALSVLFFTETFATTRGIGYFIMDAWTRADYNELFAGILGISLIGLLLFFVLDVFEKNVCKWKYVG
ncbi:MAG: ABC transporter permease subunit [Tepidanaerobacteraceae bacterium]|jgi:NitT/TauT family transport system permease protein|nr:ABC transporter permease subunit [Tepidanaerobacteraceae bacterium]